MGKEEMGKTMLEKSDMARAYYESAVRLRNKGGFDKYVLCDGQYCVFAPAGYTPTGEEVMFHCKMVKDRQTVIEYYKPHYPSEVEIILAEKEAARRRKRIERGDEGLTLEEYLLKHADDHKPKDGAEG